MAPKDSEWTILMMLIILNMLDMQIILTQYAQYADYIDQRRVGEGSLVGYQMWASFANLG